MSSTSGLTRRRGAGGAAGSPATNEGEGSNGASRSTNSYESGENGHKIAFDPRDISESAERSKQPKLTMMEEVLLLGLNDKQVRGIHSYPHSLPPHVDYCLNHFPQTHQT
jgi:Golgi phosphoprotein 3